MGGAFPWHIFVLLAVVLSIGMIIYLMDRGE